MTTSKARRILNKLDLTEKNITPPYKVDAPSHKPVIDQAVDEIIDMVKIKETENETKDSGITVESVFTDGIKKQIKSMKPTPEDVRREGVDILGTYEEMQSQGVITLYTHKIGAFFWHKALKLNHQGHIMNKHDLHCMAYTIVYWVYSHERFHHLCDVSRNLFGTKKNNCEEESLADAWAYRELKAQRRKRKNSIIAQYSKNVFDQLLKDIQEFDIPCYKEWYKYKSYDDFATGAVIHLLPVGMANKLYNNNIDLPGMLLSMEKTLGSGYITKQK